ncbi:MAG: transcription termination/antitermination factor NusG [Oligoflexales bacterium]|nr:transcription termination/antitermination factor NusG [Oligoflexales bacterium]
MSENTTQHTQSTNAPHIDSGEEATDRLIPRSNPAFNWYVINAYSGQEDKAKQTLAETIIRYGAQEFFGQMFVPKTVVEQILKSGKKKRVEKTSYPGYLLVEMLINEKSMSVIKITPKISGFVGDQRSPRPVSDAEVLRLIAPESKTQTRVESKVAFDKGESVKIIDGAFTNFEGVIEEVKPDKMKLRILVSIFGRETPVELDYHQVSKVAGQ